MKHESFSQGSSDWHQFRKTRLGGSDAPIICGLSPWKSNLQLWCEKMGTVPAPDLSSNFAVQRGVRLEPVVRGMCAIKLDLYLEPAVFTHKEYEFMSASLDGWDDDARVFIEIKVGNKKDHDYLKEDDPKTIPKKYYPQLQHQLFVTGSTHAYYCSYHLQKGEDEMRGDLKIVKVFPDEDFMSRYLPEVIAFNECLLKNIPPTIVKVHP